MLKPFQDNSLFLSCIYIIVKKGTALLWIFQASLFCIVCFLSSSELCCLILAEIITGFMWPGRIKKFSKKTQFMIFSTPDSAEPFLNCSSFGNFKVSFLLELDLAKSTESFSRAWCEMASFKLKNKSEKCFISENHGRSAPAAAAGCRAPLPLPRS